mgnify:CR=1 FL=1
MNHFEIDAELEDFSDDMLDEDLDRVGDGLRICGAGCAGCAS